VVETKAAGAVTNSFQKQLIPIFNGTVQRDFNSFFFTYMDRPTGFENFKGHQDKIRDGIFGEVKEKLFQKV
jgi:hypothetical protein